LHLQAVAGHDEHKKPKQNAAQLGVTENGSAYPMAQSPTHSEISRTTYFWIFQVEDADFEQLAKSAMQLSTIPDPLRTSACSQLLPAIAFGSLLNAHHNCIKAQRKSQSKHIRKE
jgi:hypothetical protein